MATSTGKKAVKKAPAKRVMTPAPRGPATVEDSTPVSEWKKPLPAILLPSGKAMRLRNATFQTFMRLGMIPNGLLAIVQKSIEKGKAPELNELMESTDQVEEMLQMVDTVVCFVAADPKVTAAPTQADVDRWNQQHPASAPAESPDDLRDPDHLYVDEIDDEDKMFIFGVCTGGTRDVEQFRDEQADRLASI